MVDEEQVMISVIIPVYNSEKYLHKCIDSVLKQSYQDFELILVNDGSKDSSGDICDEYAQREERVSVFHQENSGVSVARNLGIDKAKGKLLCFVDSDDWIDDTYLNDFFGFKPKDADMYVQGYINDYEESDKSNRVGFNVSQLYSQEDLAVIFIYAEINNINNSPCWKLFKSDIIRDSNLYYDESISYGEDHLFVLNYLKYVKSIFISSKSGYHYVHQKSDSLTTSYTIDEKLYYYGLEVYKARRNALTSLKINDKVFVGYIEKQFAIYILLSVASMYHSQSLINKKVRIEKIVTYTNYLKSLSLNKNFFRANYFYSAIQMILTSNIIYKDLLLRMLVNLRRIAVKFK